MSKIERLEDLQGKDREHFEKLFKEIEEKERKWFNDRGFKEIDMMIADAAFKKYLEVEQTKYDKRPFDKAPGFRRLFMMGYFYGKNK